MSIQKKIEGEDTHFLSQQSNDVGVSGKGLHRNHQGVGLVEGLSDQTSADYDAQDTSCGGELEDKTDLDLTALLRSGQFGLIRWDGFLEVEVLEGPDLRVELDEVEMTRLFVNCQRSGSKVGARPHFEQVVHMIAKDNSFDSAEEWLDKLPAWDRVCRIERFLPDYLGTGDRPYEHAVGRYLWTALVSRILYPACQADMVPVLVGPQGVRKSTLLRTIVPERDLCGEACLTDRSSNLFSKVRGKMLVAWEEVRGIKNKCDADEVKTFISSPYVEAAGGPRRKAIRHDRRFIIVGTSNKRDFLRDPTGNRRFLPVDIKRLIATDKVQADRLQLWAEALHMVKMRVAQSQAPVDYEDAERLAAHELKSFVREGRWVGEETLLRWLKEHPAPFTAEEALHEIGFRAETITSREKREMAETLRQLGLIQRSARVPGIKNPVQRWMTI